MADTLTSSYGIPKSAGGDSPDNISKMERCVMRVQKSGKSQESAIRICKTSLFGSSLGESHEDILAAQTELIAAEVEAMGKVLSKKNVQAIKACIKTLVDLVRIVEPDATAVSIEGENLIFQEVTTFPDNLSNALTDKAHTVTEKATQGVNAAGFSYNLTDDMQISLTAGERLGTFLQRARQAKFLSCTQLVEQLPIGQAAYEAIEKGYNVSPPDDILEALSQALGVDMDELRRLATLDQEDPVMSFSY